MASPELHLVIEVERRPETCCISSLSTRTAPRDLRSQHDSHLVTGRPSLPENNITTRHLALLNLCRCSTRGCKLRLAEEKARAILSLLL